MSTPIVYSGPCAGSPVARAGHTATLLKDGRVLVSGGVSSFRRGEIGPLASV